MPRRLSILMLSDVYFPRINGVSTSIETFRKDLCDLGHHVRLLAPAYGATTPDAEAGITRIAGWPVPRDPEDRWMHWHRLQRSLAALAREPWDVVHVHTPFVAHEAGIRLGSAIGRPTVVSYHTLFEEYLHHYVPLAPYAATRSIARRVSRHQCHQADAVIVPSRAIADRLGEYGVRPELLHVLPTGLPVSVFERGRGDAFRFAHGFAPDEPLALYVGRVAHEKNLPFLLEAMHGVVRTVPRATLVIAGDGPALPGLKAEARQRGLADRVRFLGYVTRGRELADCYAAADVFAFPSRTETQGLVLLEAMAQGIPVLALSEMGTREILGGCTGAEIGHDNAIAFGAQLAALLSDPSRRREMGIAAARWAERWRGPALAKRLAELYERVVPGPPRNHRTEIARGTQRLWRGTARWARRAVIRRWGRSA